MKKLLLLSLLCVPLGAMQPQNKSYITYRDSLVFAAMAATHTTAAVTVVAKSTGLLPYALGASLLMGSDYLLTKYAKGTK